MVDVQSNVNSYAVTVRVLRDNAARQGAGPMLHWGMYRASLDKWHHPNEVIPQGSASDPSTGGMRSPMMWDGGAGLWVCRFEVPTKLAPLSLAMVLFYPDSQMYEGPVRGTHFSVPIGMRPGEPGPPGASIITSSKAASGEVSYSINFSVFSRHAKGISLVLVRVQQDADGSFPIRPTPAPPGSPLTAATSALQGRGYLEVALDPVVHKTGDMWHVCVEGLKSISSMTYGWRAEGEASWADGGRFDPAYVLLDPYAPRTVPVVLPEGYWNTAPRLPPYIRMDQPVLMSSLAAFTQNFDWQGAHLPLTGSAGRGNRSLEQLVVCEVDVVAFTQDSSVPSERRGKYLGVLDRLPALVESGATAVLLDSVAYSGPTLSPGPGGTQRRTPLSLMAPDPKFAVGGPMTAAQELKQVIQAMHRAGLEVLLQLEFCVTSELSDPADAGLQGMMGIDGAVYYRRGGNGKQILNTGHPVVRKLVVDTLLHWAQEYCVDGFVLINAENLVQDAFGSVLDNPPLAEEIAHDPRLKALKLVAAVSEPALLPRSGTRGFPHWGVWAEWNMRFAGDMTAYLGTNRLGMLSAVATRITGSADLFSPRWDAGLPGGLAAGRRPAFGLNANQAPGDNPLQRTLSAIMPPSPPPSASGASMGPPSGPTTSSGASPSTVPPLEILTRTLLLAQFMSMGVPSFTASSVLGSPGLLRFVGLLAALRESCRDLLSPPLYESPRELTWHAAMPASEVDWAGTSTSPNSNVIGFSVRNNRNRAIFVVFNPYPDPLAVSMPAPPEGCAWRRVVDTGAPPPGDATLEGAVVSGAGQLPIKPRAGVVLLAVPAPRSAAASSPPGPPRVAPVSQAS